VCVYIDEREVNVDLRREGAARQGMKKRSLVDEGERAKDQMMDMLVMADCFMGNAINVCGRTATHGSNHL
jgi:hypothetical protein